MHKSLNRMDWTRMVVGYVFIASAVPKLVVHDFKGIFLSLGLPFPETILYLVAITELICGMLLIGGMYIKQAIAPLILIMLGALYLTKIPLFLNQGFVAFIFESRLDIFLLVLLLLLWQQNRDKSVDE
ncbi:DoxX family protein [Virgibacillus xinjiangensis]|uniref:DoxX family protein n=1 Tax=Virgibacillus xinjiangensis TaxID=393090 RepID=A0ABV7CXG4_9BACI